MRRPNLPSQSRRALALLLLAAVTHVLAAVPGDTVLCVGADGHVRLEARGEGCRAREAMDGRATTSASASAEASASRSACGGVCVDIPLSVSEDAVARSRDVRDAALPPTGVAPALVLDVGHDDAVLAGPILEAPRPSRLPPARRDLRTVVLRF